MTETLYVQLLDLACGALLLCAVLVLWRRELAVIIRVFAAQGVALAALVAVLAAHQHSPELWVVAVGLLILRGGVLPWLLTRALAAGGPRRRETRPLVNVAASLLAAAVLAFLATRCRGRWWRWHPHRPPRQSRSGSPSCSSGSSCLPPAAARSRSWSGSC